tara:strand:+ start:317 stop:628 length:312 start_codon:yes stop_codon:yes gene_type:complete
MQTLYSRDVSEYGSGTWGTPKILWANDALVQLAGLWSAGASGIEVEASGRSHNKLFVHWEDALGDALAALHQRLHQRPTAGEANRRLHQRPTAGEANRCCAVH